MKRALRRSWMVLLVLALSVGCANMNVEMTQEKASVWMNSIYFFQYDRYLNQVLRPDLPSEVMAEVKADPAKITSGMMRTDLTDEEKKVLRAKRKILVELHPLLLAYAGYVKNGQIPPEEISARAMQLVTLLAKELEK